MVPSENETWLIEAGDQIIVKKSEQGRDALTACERLLYCLWVADYSMRNAGDLRTAADLYPPFHEEAQQLAEELQLPKTNAAFSLPAEGLEQAYFAAFDGMCQEVQICLGR
jgi:hypothetical protein